MHNRANLFRERLSENDTWYYEMSHILGLLKHNLTEASTPTTNTCDARQLNNASLNQAITLIQHEGGMTSTIQNVLFC